MLRSDDQERRLDLTGGSVPAPESSTQAPNGVHPPKVPFTLSVGVTGHRQSALPPDCLARLPGQVRDALKLLARGAATVRDSAPECFGPGNSRFVFVSPLAEGADQIAAEIALELGFALQAVLPFARDDYRRDFSGDRAGARFDALIARCESVLELPGVRSDAPEAYMMAGRATVAHCDVLIAVWDGLPARGRGGTAEVVQLALKRGIPVVHLPVDGVAPARLVWSAFDPVVVTEGPQATTERPFDEAHVEQTLSAELLPPTDPRERRFLRLYAHERRRSLRARIEYPLLLAVTGVKRFKPDNFRDSYCAAQIEEEWRLYRQAHLDRHTAESSLDLLESAYSWSDRLAGHFAQTYRSGHVFNFVLGALAVCIGLAANIANTALFELAIVEGIVTIGIILNTRIGLKNEWHRRWLDYRQLAERLRPMRSLKLLGLAAPDPPGSVTNPVSARWIDWYSAGIWRAMGCPGGSIGEERAADLARAVAAFEIAPQVGYHERSAGQIDKLDRRLEKIAGMLFMATLVVAVIVVVGLLIAPDVINRFDSWFALIEAGFPALGTAVFGIRFQGDFGGSAVRSQTTAYALGQIDAELMRGVDLPRAADLAEQAARTMLGDLDEWRLVNQQMDLGIA
ncbi:MAG TPA: hypothetical protein VMN38_08135 [Sphingomicrobium sp.]|nr:hypothetical protein [Sphingomicrobium sp.]